MNKVSKVAEVEGPSILYNEEKYDEQGFLVAKRKMSSEGTIDYHRYYYSNDRRVVTDTIKHVGFQYDYDKATAATITTTYTFVHAQKSIYNSANVLIALYNAFLSPDSLVQRYLAFKPDSLFYAYDTCGNQDNVIWYEYGKEAHAPLKFTSSAFKNENGFEFQLHCYPFGQETWEFDLEKRLVRIKCYANSITYKYKRSRIVQIEEVLGEGYTNYTGITRERKWMTRYKYRGKSLVKAQQYFFDSNNAKEGWKEIRTVKLKRDKNGFPQMNLIGRELQYTYRLK